jgi:putative holliday junction resolvase
MGRIIGVDYGRKRCGIAVTDPAGIIASPLTTVRTHDIETFLLEYDKKETIEEFVIGYPRKMNNEPSETVKQIDPFIVRLKKIFPGKKISLVDERFSSKSAMQTMIEGGVKKLKRQDKALVDKISASIILQVYMETISKKREE